MLVAIGAMALMVLLAAPAAATNADTLKFLQQLQETIPGLSTLWTGEAYCDTSNAWPGVTCDGDDKVTITTEDIKDVVALPETYQYMELSGEYVASNVEVVSFSGAGFTTVNGSLPASWTQLTQLATFVIGAGDFCGCVPTSFEGNTVFQTAVDGLEQEVQDRLRASNCRYANTCLSESEKSNTVTFLRDIAANNGELNSMWDPEQADYCANWPLIECDYRGRVTVNSTNLTSSGTTIDFTFPPVPQDVDPEEVMVVAIDGSGFRSVRGPFPVSFGNLTNLELLTLPSNASFCGCVSAAVQEDAVLAAAFGSLGQEVREALMAPDCATANACPDSDNSGDGSDGSNGGDGGDGGNGGNGNGGPARPCDMPHCDLCRKGSKRLCQICVPGYALTPLNECREGVFGRASLLLSGILAALVGAIVLLL